MIIFFTLSLSNPHVGVKYSQYAIKEVIEKIVLIGNIRVWVVENNSKKQSSVPSIPRPILWVISQDLQTNIHTSKPSCVYMVSKMLRFPLSVHKICFKRILLISSRNELYSFSIANQLYLFDICIQFFNGI